MKLWKIVPLEEIGKYRVGDRVYSPNFGEGIVTEIDERKNNLYPVDVKWTDKLDPHYGYHDSFTLNGWFDVEVADADFDIVPADEKEKEMGQIAGVIDHNIAKKMEEDNEKMGANDEIFHAVDDAVNPAHYKVKGLPEAIDIINHLMHREQLEGYLWGNILKFAYRYGRKGDKADTAGKIAWYANQLRELGLCESPVEKKEGEHK